MPHRTLSWMRRALPALLLCSGLLLRAQSTIPVTGNVGDASDGVPPGMAVKFELYNCGSNVPRIVGVFGILKQNFTLTPDADGLLTGTIWPNDLIDCGGVTGTTRYNVTILLNNVPQTLTACYAVLSTMGTLNLNTATPCTGSSPPTPPGPPYDGFFANLNFSGLLSGGSALFAGTVRANQFLLQAAPAPCSSGGYMTGLTASFAALCATPAGASITSFNGRGGAVAPAAGDYSCAMVAGSVCALPAVYYQTVEQAGAAETQRAKLNLIGGANATVSCVDNPGANATDCTVAATSSGDSATTCGANGCYYTKPDGTVQAWGTVSVPASGTYFNTAGITFPHTFTTPPNVILTTVGLPSSSSDTSTPVAAQLQSLTTTGGSAYLARTVVASSGGGNFDQAMTLNWQAVGK